VFVPGSRVMSKFAKPSIMGIFRQNEHFSNVLLVCEAGVRVLAVCGVSFKTGGNFFWGGGLN
jgi:hypothetical protein